MSGIAIIDAGLGNIGSVRNMLKRIDADPVVITEPNKLSTYDKIVLPGVGTFDVGVGRLRERGFDEALKNRVYEGAKLLGICLGMQMLFAKSEEGEGEGLGLIPGEVTRFDFSAVNGTKKVPHMGWGYVKADSSSRLFAGLEDSSRFYFVHSYHAKCDKKNVLADCNYGYRFPCAVVNNRVFGVQFHPEKSHRYGMQLMRNFVGM